MRILFLLALRARAEQKIRFDSILLNVFVTISNRQTIIVRSVTQNDRETANSRKPEAFLSKGNNMDEKLLNEIGEMAEGCDNVLFGYQNMKTLPDRIHLQALSAKLKEVRDRLAKIYKKNGGTEELNIQA